MSCRKYATGSSTTSPSAVSTAIVALERARRECVPAVPAAVLHPVRRLEVLERLVESVLDVVGQRVEEFLPRPVFCRREGVEDASLELAAAAASVVVACRLLGVR